ncbi:hypothetical protein F4775DRAFT_568666 [Biscogniauxia sp. FL1348]|nr:hypothetical protein F4775DRAFT_568666 [Biscogniauxia sp. FL1348]
MATASVSIIVIGTLDTKLDEFLYLRSRILEHDPSINVVLIDAGRTAVAHEAISIPQAKVLEASGYRGRNENLESLPRGEVIKTMAEGATEIVKRLQTHGRMHAIISLGGSGGTSIAATVMRALPLLIPKLIVSTVASGDTSSYVAESDITMMYSVVDIAGLNKVLRAVVDNAAAAIVGMAKTYAARSLKGGTGKKRRSVGLTMFGVTTTAVDNVRRWLGCQGQYEAYVFHATGAGGRAMERLIREGQLDAVVDLTTTELADELVGGVFSAGEDRLTAAAKVGIPQIVSVGALDMVNFGPKDTVPSKFQSRTLFKHNPSVTLMRTTPQECEELGRRLAQRLKDNCTQPKLIEVWLPLKGISAISVEGQPFYDKAADAALFAAVEKGLDGSGIEVVKAGKDINDALFGEDIGRRIVDLVQLHEEIHHQNHPDKVPI